LLGGKVSINILVVIFVKNGMPVKAGSKSAIADAASMACVGLMDVAMVGGGGSYK
jgi:hypothetical protein